MTQNSTTDCWLIDLDGVVWLADKPIPGSREAIEALRKAGHRVAFFTNNSFSSRKEMFAKFERHGIVVDDEDLLSSAQAAARLVPSDVKVTVFGGEGITEALQARGIEVMDLDSLPDSATPEAVLVGLDRSLSFRRLTNACRSIHQGAKFIATNDDTTYPTSEGLLPGAGALVAAVSYTTGVTPVVAGKPHPPAVELVQEVLGSVVMGVGDRPETDGELARALGARFGLVRSGVTPAGKVVDPPPDLDAPDLAALVAMAIGVTRDLIVEGKGVDSSHVKSLP